jgi:hypothetical protein
MGMSGAGAIMMFLGFMVYMGKLFQMDTEVMPELDQRTVHLLVSGGAVFAAAWLWSLVTGIGLVRASTTDAPKTPPTITGA